MAKVTLEQIITVLIGIPGTDDQGIAGDVKELVKGQGTQNTAIERNKNRIAALYWVLGVLFSGGGITFIVLKAIGAA